ncbi:MAG: glycoside hydrolase family 32 protein [Deinococcales bacterium]
MIRAWLPFYTGVKNGIQGTCIAHNNPNDATLSRWQKYPQNPILTAPDFLNIHHKAYRDPYLWREADTWYQVIGTSIDNRGEVLLYRSQDLLNWEYLHPLVPREIRASLQDDAHIWECPNFFPLGDKYVLIISSWHENHLNYPVAFIGEFRELYFYPESMQQLDQGSFCYYAPLSMLDPQGRRLIWGWLQEQRSLKAQLRSGWSGVMSLPRELFLADGRVEGRFVAELSALREKEHRISAQEISEIVYKQDFQGLALEFEINLEARAAPQTKLTLNFAEEKLDLVIDWSKARIELNSYDLSLHPQQSLQFSSLTHLNLHFYLDHSALELIAKADGQSQMLSKRLYPQHAQGVTLSLSSEGGTSQLATSKVWELKQVF